MLVGPGAVPGEFRRALLAVPPAERDVWVDRALGIDGIPEDGPSLPRGCVPYLPCPVNTLLGAIDDAAVSAEDVFVDIGAGLGRALLLTHLLTGAGALGVEIQPHLVRAAQQLAARHELGRCSVVLADAASAGAELSLGSVFFLYCPFSGARLESVLDALGRIASVRPIRICCLDLVLPARPWLTRIESSAESLAVYRGTPLAAGARRS